MKPRKLIDTDDWSSRYRAASIDLENKRVLVTNYHDTEQEKDLTEPANCDGFGRIRHFHRVTSGNWPANPLPIDPARKALRLPSTDMLRAQVYQNAACNWRCWYCFVPFALLSANPKHSRWLSPAELVNLYLSQPDPPRIIDLTGGEPDLVPEWVPWMMAELKDRGIAHKVYLWSDGNLSNDYFWRFLSEADLTLITSYLNYGRVGCFKGFDADSFSFNTRAEPDLFSQQFELLNRLLRLGIDLYAYATFTAASVIDIKGKMAEFVDRLQSIDENLPLRTVPLEIKVFTPVKHRIDAIGSEALKNQYTAVEAWQYELENRYSSKDRTRNISDIPMRGLKTQPG